MKPDILSNKEWYDLGFKDGHNYGWWCGVIVGAAAGILLTIGISLWGFKI